MNKNLIGNTRVGLSGIYNPDENNALVSSYEDLSKYIYNQNSTQTIPNTTGTFGDLYIKPDETKVYIVDNTTDCIHQYNLSAPEVTADYYNIKQLYLALQEIDPTDLYFKPDGTELYITGQTGVAPLTANSDYVHQYTLSTAWDVATARYTTSFLVTTQTTTPVATYIGAAGTAMYVLGVASVFQYTLGTAWNLTTASYASKTISVTAQDTAPTGMTFKDDGTKMYILGDTNNRVYQYTLSTPWDVATATYDNKSYGIQDATSQGLYFKPDGKKLYVIGNTGDQVHEYILQTAWDVSTAYYPRNYVNITNYDTDPRGVGFSTDGTKIYIVGNAVDRVWQFSLETAWDIRTVDITPTHFIGDVEGSASGLTLSDDGRYAYVTGSNKVSQFRMQTPWNIKSIPNDTQIFYVGYQDGGVSTPTDLFFSSDGTSLYALGNTAVAPLVAGGEYVHQYTLSTAWDITTAGWSTSFSVTAQTSTLPTGMYIGAAGTSMYVLSEANDSVFQYTLGTAWNVNTSTYASKSFSVGAQDSSPQAITFKSDGTKMYVVGTNNNQIILQYSLSSAWDVSTATYDNKYHWIGYIGETNPRGIYFKDDGTKVYVNGALRDVILSFSLSTAWDISTATYDNSALGIFGYDGLSQGLFLKSDGTRVYFMGDDFDHIVSIGLATAWDLSSATVSTISLPVGSGACQAISLKSDGTKLYIYDSNNDLLQQCFLYSPWNISSIYNDFKWRSLKYYDGLITGLSFKNDGSRFYVVGQINRRALTFPLETPWEVSPYFNSYFLRFIEGGPRDLYFKPDGTKVFVIGERSVLPGLIHDSEYVHEFSLSTPWNLNTVGYTTSVGIGTTLETSSHGLFFKDDGSKMYVVGGNSDRVYQYNLTTPWSVNTASYENKNISVSGQDTLPRGLYIGAAGTALYMVGDNSDRISQYTLGTAWDVSTATYTNNFYSVTSQEGAPQSVWFKDDGTKMYVVGTGQDRVYQYSLSTPWNITTVSYDKKSYSVTSFDSTPYGLTFKSDGSKFYVVGDASCRIIEFPLSTPWDVENSPVDVGLNTPIISPTYGFDFKTYSTGSVDTDPVGLFFKPDGTTMYVVGVGGINAAGFFAGGDYVYQFSLGTAWDMNTVGYTTSFFLTHSSVAPAEFFPTDVYVGAAGTGLYVLSDTANALYRYTLSTPWNVGTASTTVGITSIALNDLNASAAFRETTPTGLTFKPDGTKFYVVGTDKDTVFQYSLSTAWDITTASIERQFYVGNFDATPQAVYFREDGTYMYTIGSTGGILYEYSLSTPWDVNTALYTGFNLTFDGGARGLYLKSDGTSVYVLNTSSDVVLQINLKEPWKLFPSASKALNITSGSNNITTPVGIQMSSDLQRLYVVGGANRGLHCHDFKPS